MSSTNRPGHSRFLSVNSGVPMSIFNTQLIQEASKSSPNNVGTPTGSTYASYYKMSRPSRTNLHRAVSMSVTASTGEVQIQKVRRTMSTHQSTSYHQSFSHARPLGPELVAIKQPSCTGLPPRSWTTIHDRFIAYLATHAPLDKSGRVQRKEESRERWRNEDIAILVMDRFREMDGCIKVSMIENRLDILDQAGDNDYFKMPYGAYKYEKWGRGV